MSVASMIEALTRAGAIGEISSVSESSARIDTEFGELVLAVAPSGNHGCHIRLVGGNPIHPINARTIAQLRAALATAEAWLKETDK